MASGFQTSDGVDLDSRYLGINAKAKSAATADTATTATRADTLVNNRYASKVAVVIVNLSPEAYSSKTWSAPSDGIFSILSVNSPTGSTQNTATVLGVTYGFGSSTSIGTLQGGVFVFKKGDSITTNRPGDVTFSFSAKFIPLSQR